MQGIIIWFSFLKINLLPAMYPSPFWLMLLPTLSTTKHISGCVRWKLVLRGPSYYSEVNSLVFVTFPAWTNDSHIFSCAFFTFGYVSALLLSSANFCIWIVFIPSLLPLLDDIYLNLSASGSWYSVTITSLSFLLYSSFHDRLTWFCSSLL